MTSSFSREVRFSVPRGNDQLLLNVMAAGFRNVEAGKVSGNSWRNISQLIRLPGNTSATWLVQKESEEGQPAFRVPL